MSEKERPHPDHEEIMAKAKEHAATVVHHHRYVNGCDLHARHAKLPDGFTAHAGGECPVDPRATVELMILTGDGIGSSGICRARLHDWTIPSNEHGAVLGYRLIADGDIGAAGARPLKVSIGRASITPAKPPKA